MDKPDKYKDGDVIITRPLFSPPTALREVEVVDNGKVRVKGSEHIFTWYFF